MTHHQVERNLRVRDATLDDYEGGMTNLLRGLLTGLGCESRIPVKIYSYWDDVEFIKFRITIQLPRSWVCTL